MMKLDITAYLCAASSSLVRAVNNNPHVDWKHVTEVMRTAIKQHYYHGNNNECILDRILDQLNGNHSLAPFSFTSIHLRNNADDKGPYAVITICASLPSDPSFTIVWRVKDRTDYYSTLTLNDITW